MKKKVLLGFLLAAVTVSSIAMAAPNKTPNLVISRQISTMDLTRRKAAIVQIAASPVVM